MSMNKLEIYDYQAKQIADTLRMAGNALESYKLATCLDRNVMQSKAMIQLVIDKDIDILPDYGKMHISATNDQEFIACSAIHYDDGKVHNHQPRNIKTGYVICGLRHNNCIMTFKLMHEHLTNEERLAKRKVHTEGFLTSKNRFVDRFEAYEIAKAANQLKIDAAKRNMGLDSSDIF